MQSISSFEPILAKIGHLCPPQKVLEIGCGEGDLIFEIGRTYRVSAVGIDLDPTRIDAAQKKAIERGVDDQINFFPWNAEHSNFAHEIFDLVILHNTFSELAHPEEVVAEIHTILKPTGMLYIIETSPKPSSASIAETAGSCFIEMSNETIEGIWYYTAAKKPL